MACPRLATGQDCAQISNDAERLACYDAGNKPSEAETSLAEAETTAPEPAADPRPAATEAAGTVTAIEASSPEEFGKDEPFDKPREYVEGTIVEIRESGGVHYFRLDSGPDLA